MKQEKSVIAMFNVQVMVGNKVKCFKPMDGFTTMNKVYEVVGLRPEEQRIVISDDRGKECWTNAQRFAVVAEQGN